MASIEICFAIILFVSIHLDVQQQQQLELIYKKVFFPIHQIIITVHREHAIDRMYPDPEEMKLHPSFPVSFSLSSCGCVRMRLWLGIPKKQDVRGGGDCKNSPHKFFFSYWFPPIFFLNIKPQKNVHDVELLWKYKEALGWTHPQKNI